MSTSRPSVAQLAVQLQEALDSALAENERLTAQSREFENRADAAEKRAKEVQQKLEILETLKSKQYQTVVTELFEGPSRRAARLTLLIAVASIAIGLAQTFISSVYSSRSNSQAIVEFSRSLRSQLRQDIVDSARQTKEEVNSIVRDISRDGTTQARALGVTPGATIQSVVALNGYRYYEVVVPPGTARLQVALTTPAPGHAHVYARHSRILDSIPNMASPRHTRDACLNGHVNNNLDQCVIDGPTPGTWYLRIDGFAATSPFKLVAQTSNASSSGASKPSVKLPSKARAGA